MAANIPDVTWSRLELYNLELVQNANKRRKTHTFFADKDAKGEIDVEGLRGCAFYPKMKTMWAEPEIFEWRLKAAGIKRQNWDDNTAPDEARQLQTSMGLRFDDIENIRQADIDVLARLYQPDTHNSDAAIEVIGDILDGEGSRPNPVINRGRRLRNLPPVGDFGSCRPFAFGAAKDTRALELSGLTKVIISDEDNPPSTPSRSSGSSDTDFIDPQELFSPPLPQNRSTAPSNVPISISDSDSDSDTAPSSTPTSSSTSHPPRRFTHRYLPNFFLHLIPSEAGIDGTSNPAIINAIYGVEREAEFYRLQDLKSQRTLTREEIEMEENTRAQGNVVSMCLDLRKYTRGWVMILARPIEEIVEDGVEYRYQVGPIAGKMFTSWKSLVAAVFGMVEVRGWADEVRKEWGRSVGEGDWEREQEGEDGDGDDGDDDEDDGGDGGGDHGGVPNCKEPWKPRFA